MPNKRKIALIAGCSHSAGSEMDGTEDSVFNRENSFGGVLAKMVGREPINIALNGATNTTIARSVLNWFDKEYDANTMDVFVIVGWTESCRMEIPCEEGKYYNESNKDASWYDTEANLFNRVIFGWAGGTDHEKEIFPIYQRFMSENSSLVELWSANAALQLQEFFRANHIQYVMTNTLYMFTQDDRFVQSVLKFIDTKNYYNMYVTQDDAFYWKYRNQGYVNENAQYWHHGQEPHRLFAEELYDFIKENQCLDGLND